MEHLRVLLTGPSQAAAGLAGPPAPASAPFAEVLSKEGARASGPQAATLDSYASPLDLERRESAFENRVPDSEFGLTDFLDVINPLQHIPIIANIYRYLTGDTISGPAQVAGGALYGGPVGMLAGIANAVAVESNGRDLGESLVASIMGESVPDATLVAEAAHPPAVLEPTPEQTAHAAPIAASFAPQPQNRVLTGDAALSALFGDLRATSAAPVSSPPLPAPRSSDAATPRRGEDRPSNGSANPATARAASVHGFADRMMLGLDRYRALATERGGPGRPAPDRVDRPL